MVNADNISKLRDLGIDLKGKTSGQFKTICPKCGPTRKHKKDRSLSVDIDQGVYQCWNHPCDFRGGVSAIESKWKRPEPITTETALSASTQQVFSARGIGPEVIRRNKITEEKGWIRFNYYRDGQLINIKYRGIKEKKFMQFAEAESIFYGLDDCKDASEIIIVEGEFDRLALNQCGIWNVLSVPQGAGDKLDCIQNCFAYFDNDKTIIVAVDNDEPGRKLEKTLIQRFGADRLKFAEWPGSVKDANDCLLRHGKEVTIAVIEEAEYLPPEGVKFLWDRREEMIDTYRYGKPKGEDTHFALSGVYSWYPGQVKCMTGVPGDGKTEFELNLMLTRSIRTGAKWAVFSPEYFPADEFYDGLIQAYIGKGVDPAYPTNYATEGEYIAAMNFVQDHFFYVYPEDEGENGEAIHTPENVFRICKQLILKYGVKGILIDPFNQLEHKRNPGEREDEYLGRHFLQTIRFARSYRINITYIAHPKSQQKDKNGNYSEIREYDLAGGAMWANKMDVIGVVSRPERYEEGGDIYIAKIKFHKVKMQKRVGAGGEMEYRYNPKTGRYTTRTGFCPIEEARKAQAEKSTPEMFEDKDDNFFNGFWNG